MLKYHLSSLLASNLLDFMCNELAILMHLRVEARCDILGTTHNIFSSEPLDYLLLFKNPSSVLQPVKENFELEL